VADSCTAGAAAMSGDWLYPQDPAGEHADDRRYIVGRWQICDQSIFGLPAHSAIEFGANGRWLLYDIDARTGEWVPHARTGMSSGYYYLYGFGQLDLHRELPSDGYMSFPVSFINGMDAINFNNPVGLAEVYARTTPSPLNGADNPPPTAAGPCSLLGDWNVLANNAPAGARPSVFSFDVAGNFVLGGQDTDLCQAPEAHGTYALSPGIFQMTGSTLGCGWPSISSYAAAFDASCNRLSLKVMIDDCTGGGYFDTPKTITRRLAVDGAAKTTP
jgi:hypothetical protein